MKEVVLFWMTSTFSALVISFLSYSWCLSSENVTAFNSEWVTLGFSANWFISWTDWCKARMIDALHLEFLCSCNDGFCAHIRPLALTLLPVTQVYVTLAGILCIGFAIIFAMGLLSYANVAWGPLHNVLPFLLLGNAQISFCHWLFCDMIYMYMYNVHVGERLWISWQRLPTSLRAAYCTCIKQSIYDPVLHNYVMIQKIEHTCTSV